MDKSSDASQSKTENEEINWVASPLIFQRNSWRSECLRSYGEWLITGLGLLIPSPLYFLIMLAYGMWFYVELKINLKHDGKQKYWTE